MSRHKLSHDELLARALPKASRPRYRTALAALELLRSERDELAAACASLARRALWGAIAAKAAASYPDRSDFYRGLVVEVLDELVAIATGDPDAADPEALEGVEVPVP